MMKDMKWLIVFSAGLVIVSVLASHPAPAATKPPTQGGVLPSFELVAPEDSADESYLGLSGGDRFTISQIKAKVVIVELFSMY